LTVIDFSKLKQAIEKVIEFIWKNIYCTNIRVEIFHLKDEATGQIKVEPDVKNAYT
jgi:hypothetical protein